MPQLADLIRKKYPGQYDDMDDASLEAAVLEKHPEYADLVTPLETKPIESVEPEQSTLSKVWHKASDPLWEGPSRFGKQVSESITTPKLNNSYPRLKGFIGGASQGLGDVLSGLTSPINLAMMLGSGGSSIAGKYGLETIASALSGASRGAGALMAGHGASNVLSPSSSLGERGFGLAEIAGGILGMRGHTPKSSNILKKPIREIPPEVQKIIDNPIDIPSEIVEPLPANELPPDLVQSGLEVEFNKGRKTTVRDPEQWTYDLARKKFRMGQDPESIVNESLVEPPYDSGKTVLPFDDWTNQFKPINESTKLAIPLDKSKLWREAVSNHINPREYDIDNPTDPMFQSELQRLSDDINKKQIKVGNWDIRNVKKVENVPSDVPSIPRELGLNKIGKSIQEPEVVPQGNMPFNLITNAEMKYMDDFQYWEDTMFRGTNEPIDILFLDPESRSLFEAGQNLLKNGEIQESRIKRLNERANRLSKIEKISIQDARKYITDYNIEIRRLGKEIDVSGGTLTAPSFDEFLKTKLSDQSMLNRLKSEKGVMNIETSPIKVDPRTQALLDKRLLSEDKSGKFQSLYDLPRGLMSVDPPFITSAAFRQGNAFIGMKAWREGWAKSAKAYGNKIVYEKMESDALQQPYFKPDQIVRTKAGKPIRDAEGKIKLQSIADQSGLRQGDLAKFSKRDDVLRGQLAEEIPIYGRHVKASNRAYNAELNHLSRTIFSNLMDDATKASIFDKIPGLRRDPKAPSSDPMQNHILRNQIAEFVNTALKRGKIGVEAGSYELNLEKHSRLLSNTLFSPRTISSITRMLNPSTYIMSDPYIRKQYLAATLRMVGMWWTMAEAAKLGGATVVDDPNSTDYGKIKIGNMRIDPPGGLQQYLVLAKRMMPRKTPLSFLKTHVGHPLIDLPSNLIGSGGGGITSTNTNRFTSFGKGFKPETRSSTLETFGANRLHPVLKNVYDFLSKTSDKPYHMLDRNIQMAVPIFTSDLSQIAQDDPFLAKMIFGGLLSGAGMGVQNYDRGSFKRSTFIPEKYDWNIK